MFYYIIVYYSFICLCSNKAWFKNKSFKSRKATESDIKRFKETNSSLEISYNNTNVTKERDDKKVSLLDTTVNQ